MTTFSLSFGLHLSMPLRFQDDLLRDAAGAPTALAPTPTRYPNRRKLVNTYGTYSFLQESISMIFSQLLVTPSPFPHQSVLDEKTVKSIQTTPWWDYFN